MHASASPLTANPAANRCRAWMPRCARPRAEEAQQRVAQHDHRVHREQVVGRRRARVALDVHQPRHRPQALDRHERAHAEAADRRQPPEPRMHEHRAHAGELRRETARVHGLRDVGHAPPDRERDGERHDGQADEHAAPVRERQRELERHRRRQRADAAGHHDPAASTTRAGPPDTTRRSPSAAPSGTRRRRRRSARARPQGRSAFPRARTAPRPRPRRRAAPARRGAVRSGRAGCRPESASRRTR